MRKAFAPIVALAIAGAGLATLFALNRTPAPVTSTYFLMDTVLTIKTTGADAAALNDQLHALASKVDTMTSYYKPESETVRINAAAGKQSVTVSQAYAALLETAIDAEKVGQDSKFDIAISPVSSLWGFTTKDFKIPTAKEIAETLAYSHTDQIHVDGTSVGLQDPRARIDLGGVAKGYSLDVMENYLSTVKPQPKQVIVDFGGNLLLYSGGRKHDWRVGIRDPRGDGIIGYVVSGDAFVATSGDYERYFERDGKRYCHIIDPTSGYPASLNQSATVITEIQAMHGALGDALGKVFFCSRPQYQQALFDTVKTQGVVGVVLVDAGGSRSTLGPITLVPETAG
ncbi:MAG: FAD:protein FMN transferase [Candidatus Cryosericum sp.]